MPDPFTALSTTGALTLAATLAALLAFALAPRLRRARRLRPIALAVSVVGVTLLATGCGGSDDDSGDGSVKVVATTTQVADFVRQVGGEQVEVTQILQPNTDPHEYEPRPSDVEAFVDADLVFRSGGHLDEWTQQLIDDSGSKAEMVDLSAGLPVQLEGSEEHEHAHEGEDHAEGEAGHEDHGDEIDPHWWLDPVNVKTAVTEIEGALTTADPDGESEFAANAAAYQKQLASLNRSIAKCFDSLAPAQRKMVTDHDALGYFGNRYGIEIVGAVIPALTTQAQPSAGDLAELEKEIREEKVKAVFPESSVSKSLAEAVAADTGASTKYQLYADTLGPADSDGATYIEMMESNADKVMLGLTGDKQGCPTTGIK